jgi:tetrahydromethanopterin S-methyltransferase subunit G
VFSEENFTDAIVVEASRFKKIARKKKFLEIQKYVQRTIAHLYQVITHKIL